jgi:hypothetical protein
MFAAIGIQNVMLMRHNVICGSKIRFHTVAKKGTIFERKKNIFEHTNTYRKSLMFGTAWETQ